MEFIPYSTTLQAVGPKTSEAWRAELRDASQGKFLQKFFFGVNHQFKHFPIAIRLPIDIKGMFAVFDLDRLCRKAVGFLWTRLILIDINWFCFHIRSVSYRGKMSRDFLNYFWESHKSLRRKGLGGPPRVSHWFTTTYIKTLYLNFGIELCL